MANVRPAPQLARRTARLSVNGRARTALWVGYGLLGAYLAGYLVSMVRGPDPGALFSDWSIGAFELVASLMCVARGFTRRPGRVVALTLGLALLLWALGDISLVIQSRDGVTPATPSLTDVFYLGFFPATYVALVIFMRGELKRLSTPSWLDGAVAGVGAAALCSAFVFPRILHLAGGSPIEVMTKLAYPVGDVLLLSLVIGGSTVMTGRRKAPWVLLVLGIVINVVGDSANLFAASWGRPGFILDAIAWPASILVMSMAVWLRPRPSNPLTLQKPGTFVIPGLSAFSAVVILFVGNLHETSRAALGLATTTLVLVGARLILSVRGMRALSQERRDQSITDDLTGLGNRRCLTTVLDAFFVERDDTAPEQRKLAFLFIDLNNFKQINDTFGHPAGDQMLKQLGPRLTDCLRESDLLTRLGGDEFVALLVDADAEYATAVAQRLTEGLVKPFTLETTHASISAGISASIGIALSPADATDAAGLLHCADIAMFRAKLSDAPFAIYHPDLDSSGNRLRLLEELRTAIEEHQLILHYQPQLDLRTGQIVAVESLIRWVHPTLGIIPPDDFLPFAEDAGLMGAITTLVLSDALAQCAAWTSSGNPLSVAVNISPTNLLEPGFTDLVRDLLHSHHVPAGALVLEITETSVIAEFDRSQQVIQELKDLGITVSIDDFGAGFTSLAHLSSLAVKELKLDITFIRKLTAKDNEHDLDLVRATIDLGHALGLKIVAEGIEDGATLDLLADLGCDLGQGYFISRPMQAAHLDLNPRLFSPQPVRSVG
ncbi:MAG: bifunctional diguanylate cyclase/phosphodiesterase [Actinomycetota bacterium]